MFERLRKRISTDNPPKQHDDDDHEDGTNEEPQRKEAYDFSESEEPKRKEAHDFSEKEEVYPAYTEGFSLASRPAPLETDTLYAGIENNDPAAIPQLYEFYNEWHQFASDRNLFSTSGGPKQEMWKAIVETKNLAEIFHASEGAEKEEAGRRMKDLIGRINGDLSENLEDAALKNEKLTFGRISETSVAERRSSHVEAIHSAAELLGSIPAAEPAPRKSASRDLGGTFDNPAKAEGAVSHRNHSVVEFPVRPAKEKQLSARQEAALEAVAEEKGAMDVSEKAYLSAYKEYYSQKGAKEKKEPEELRDLKRAYDESRIIYAEALTRNADKRIESRGVRRGVKDREYTYDKEAVLQRYNRLVRFNEIVKPAAQKKYAAKLEALGSREQGMFSKGLSWVGAKNKELEERFGKNGARVVRVAASTIIAGGSAAAFGALGTAGLLGALGYGTVRFGKSLARSFIGAGFYKAAGKAYESVYGRGKMEGAQDKLAYEGRTSGMLSVEDLEDYDQERSVLTKRADVRTLEREKAWVGALTAMGIGAGSMAASILSEIPSGVSGIHEIAGSAAPAHEASSISQSVPGSHEAAGIHAPSPESVPTHQYVFDHGRNLESSKGITISGNINNADRMFGRFHDQLVKDFPNPEDPNTPPAVKTLLQNYTGKDGLHAQDALTRMLGLQNGGSVILHQGDSLSLSKAGSIVFHHAGEKNFGHEVIDINGAVKSPSELHSFLTYTEHGTKAPTHEINAAQTPAEAVQPVQTHVPLESNTPTQVPLHPTEQPPAQYDMDQITANVADPTHPAHISLDSVTQTPPIEHIQDPSVVDHAAENADIVVTAHVNGHGVPIDPNSAHTYQIGKKGAALLWGGTFEERTKKVSEFFSDPKNHGKPVFTQADTIDPMTKKPAMVMYVSDDNGTIGLQPTVTEKHGGIPLLGLFSKERMATMPDPEKFTKRLD